MRKIPKEMKDHPLWKGFVEWCKNPKMNDEPIDVNNMSEKLANYFSAYLAGAIVGTNAVINHMRITSLRSSG